MTMRAHVRPIRAIRAIRATTTALFAATALLLSACIVVPAGRHHGNGSVDYAVPVMVAPPEAQVEVIGAAPGPAYFWIGGYWNWVGNRHVWIGGHWEGRRAGYGWVPHQWQRDGRGWRAAPGYWRRG